MRQRWRRRRRRTWLVLAEAVAEAATAAEAVWRRLGEGVEALDVLDVQICPLLCISGVVEGELFLH